MEARPGTHRAGSSFVGLPGGASSLISFCVFSEAKNCSSRDAGCEGGVERKAGIEGALPGLDLLYLFER